MVSGFRMAGLTIRTPAAIYTSVGSCEVEIALVPMKTRQSYAVRVCDFGS